MQLDAAGNASITASQINNGSSDDAGNVTLSIVDGAFDCSDLFSSVPVTLTVTDASGNSTTAVANVTVEDNVLPTVTLIGDATVNHNAFTTYADLGATEADNCSVTLTSSDDVNTSISGSYTVTYTATDGSGNVAQATRTVIVQDITVPTAIAQDITVQLDVTGHVSITPSQIDNGSIDDSNGALTYALDQTSFDCSNLIATTSGFSFDGVTNSSGDQIFVNDPSIAGLTTQTVEAWVRMSNNANGNDVWKWISG